MATAITVAIAVQGDLGRRGRSVTDEGLAQILVARRADAVAQSHARIAAEGIVAFGGDPFFVGVAIVLYTLAVAAHGHEGSGTVVFETSPQGFEIEDPQIRSEGFFEHDGLEQIAGDGFVFAQGSDDQADAAFAVWSVTT